MNQSLITGCCGGDIFVVASLSLEVGMDDRSMDAIVILTALEKLYYTNSCQNSLLLQLLLSLLHSILALKYRP